MIALANKAGGVESIGPSRALIDPGAEQADLFRRQAFPFLGHNEILLDASDQLNQPTRCAVAGHDDRAVVTAPQGIVFVVEPQTVFLLLGSVAGITIRDEKRFNI